MSGQRTTVKRIPRKYFEPRLASIADQQRTMQKAFQAHRGKDITKMAHEAIAAQASKFNPGRSARMAGRLGGLAGRAARIASSAEGGVALAAAGAAIGIGQSLIEGYHHKKADESFKKHGYQEISAEGVKTYLPGSQPESTYSSGAHRVSHVHAVAAPTVEAPGKFEQRRSRELQQIAKPMRGYKVPNNRPYQLIDWEQGARAMAIMMLQS